MVSLDFLERMEMFKDLDDEQLKAIQVCCQEVEFKRGQQFFGAGEKPNYLWTVKEGQVDLQQESDASILENFTITSLSETMTFGWSSLVSPYKHTLSAYCTSRICKVVRVEKQCLIGLFEKDARIGYRVMSKLVPVVGKRFQQLQNEVANRRGHEIINQW